MKPRRSKKAGLFLNREVSSLDVDVELLVERAFRGLSQRHVFRDACIYKQEVNVSQLFRNFGIELVPICQLATSAWIATTPLPIILAASSRVFLLRPEMATFAPSPENALPLPNRCRCSRRSLLPLFRLAVSSWPVLLSDIDERPKF